MIDRFHGPEGRPLLVEALRTQSVIGDDAALAELIAASVEVEAFEAGTVVMRESGADNDICFILAGVVSVRVLGREIAARTAGQHVGEMALVDPGQRRSATVVAEDGVVIARLAERSFTALGESHPRLWRNVARELTHRLRQRNTFVEPVNSRPVLFVGCSAESIPIADAIQAELKCDPIEITVWTDGVFTASTFPIESLERVLRTVDFAALVLSPDDTEFAAHVYKSYLVCAARIIRSENGTITAYDGDRIMAVYTGGSKDERAARTALKINFAVQEIINPAIKDKYPTSNYSVRQVVGIDTSELFVARTGIRGFNELVWVGRAANHAAKLSSRSGPPSQITAEVHDLLSEELRHDQDGRRIWTRTAAYETGHRTIYTSAEWWRL